MRKQIELFSKIIESECEEIEFCTNQSEINTHMKWHKKYSAF